MIPWQEPLEALGGQTLEDWFVSIYPTASNREIQGKLAALGMEISLSGLRSKAERIGVRKEIQQHAPVEWQAPEPTPDADWREILESAKVFQKHMRRHSPNTYHHEPITIHTNRPIALACTADWHLGSSAVDYVEWQNDMQYLLDTPGLYAVVVGDENNNVRSFKTLSAVIEQVIPVSLQRDLLMSITRELIDKHKILATTWSNHTDEFDERLIGESLMAEFRRAQGVPHLNGQDLLRLRIGQGDHLEEYTLYLTHKARFRSFLNPTHGAMRLYHLGFPADVIVTAHDHRPAYQSFSQYELARELGYGFGGTSYLVACSTYKTEDAWAHRYFGRVGLSRPTVVLWPDEHHIEVFDDARSAVERAQSAR